MTISSGSGLTHAAFLIMLSLADRPRHGLGVIDEVEERTGGSVKLGPGTLYGTIKRLVADGYVREATRAPDPADDDPRRRYYELTGAGKRALAAEAEHLRRLLHVAEGKGVLASGG